MRPSMACHDVGSPLQCIGAASTVIETMDEAEHAQRDKGRRSECKQPMKNHLFAEMIPQQNRFRCPSLPQTSHNFNAPQHAAFRIRIVCQRKCHFIAHLFGKSWLPRSAQQM
mmetsp:Transcript_10506/g.28959  ORF Transcript_10506/g.28959 Transcript_10506/m.28959 type:complete len:112 (-) Transcript_10506:1560-1895(-)